MSWMSCCWARGPGFRQDCLCRRVGDHSASFFDVCADSMWGVQRALGWGGFSCNIMSRWNVMCIHVDPPRCCSARALKRHVFRDFICETSSQGLHFKIIKLTEYIKQLINCFVYCFERTIRQVHVFPSRSPHACLDTETKLFETNNRIVFL